MPTFTPQQISPEEGGTLCGTLGKAECEFVAAVIIRWHHLNYHTTWEQFSRRDLATILETDELTKSWARNPFWRPNPHDFAQRGFIVGWDKDADSLGTLEKFFNGIAKKVRADNEHRSGDTSAPAREPSAVTDGNSASPRNDA